MSEQLIPEDKLSKQDLKQLFSDAYYQASIESDGDILIQGRFKYWVQLDDSHRFIRFSVHFKSNPKANSAARLGYANRVNNEMIVLRAAVPEGGVTLDQYHWIQGGVGKKNVIMAFRTFEQLVTSALGRDQDDVIA